VKEPSFSTYATDRVTSSRSHTSRIIVSYTTSTNYEMSL